MPSHRLARGMQLTIRGRDYTIEKRLPNNEIQIKDIVTNEYSAKSESLLVELLFQGDAELLGDNRNQDFLKKRLERTRVSDLTLFAEADPRRPAFDRRRSYVRAVMKEKPTVFTKETLLPIIEKTGETLGEYPLTEFHKLSSAEQTEVLSNRKLQPSFSAVWRWVKTYRQSGEDERVLVSAVKAQGNRRRKFSGRMNDKIDDQRAARVLELLNQSIEEVFMQEQRFTVQAVYDDLVVKIADENVNRDPENQLPRPHINSVYKAINKLDDYEILKARYGERIANEKYSAYKQGPRPTRPLERVEMDHTKTDLFVIDPVLLLPIGRAYLTWMICVYTKMILGFYISFTPPSSLSVMECLKHAIRPKTYVRGKYPTIRHEWEAYGIMERLVVDNAVEFHGKHLEEACRQLGCNIQYGKKGSPWYRASIERSIGTANTQLLHQQPGTTFSDIADLADYDPKKNAVITLDTLDEIVHKYIIDVYQHSKHRGIKDIPALRWKEGVSQWPPALPAKAADLDVLLSLIEYRTISHSGIELDTLFYNDDSLAMLRSQMKPGAKFAIKRNPSDVSKIHVYDEKHDRYITVPAVDQDYTNGLTLWQHSVIKRYVRERLEKDVDIIALCRAKREIRDIVERDWAKVKTSRVRMARFRNEGVQERREGIETAVDESKLTAELPGSVAGPLLLNSGDPEADDYRSGISDLASAFNAHSAEGSDSVKTNTESTPAVAVGIVKGTNKKVRHSKRAKTNQVQISTSQTGDSHNRKAGDITDELSSEITLDQDDSDWGTSYDLRGE
jgi:putative transposase